MRTRSVALFVVAAGIMAFGAYRDHENKQEQRREEATAAFRACSDLEVTKGLMDQQRELDARDLETTARNIGFETPAVRDYRKAQTALLKEALMHRDFTQNAAAWECRQLVRATYGD